MKYSKENRKALPKEVYSLYDDYAHNRIDRRDFVHQLSLFAIGGLTVNSLLQDLLPDYSKASQVSLADPRISSEYITYNSPEGGGEIRALLCVPSGLSSKAGSVLVVHENRGLNPYIEDVARRLALAGFISLAPDALSPHGGYPGNVDEGRALQAKRDRMEMLEDFKAGFQYLGHHQQSNGRVGVVGFCFGGWIANMMATQVAALSSSVSYYGAQPPLDAVKNIECPLQLHFAEFDARVNEGWPAYELALRQHQKNYAVKHYPGVHHGFHNDTTSRYDELAAKLAWDRTLTFFKDTLG